ncbi:MAG: hypothetical protein WDN75_11655 [Bacteroidota bacterium]
MKAPAGLPQKNTSGIVQRIHSSSKRNRRRAATSGPEAEGVGGIGLMVAVTIVLKLSHILVSIET